MKIGCIQPNISFRAKNAEDLKKLYSYDIPCMYTGVTMIDSQDIVSLNKQALNGALPLVVKTLEPYEDRLQIAEKKVFSLIKEGAKVSPNMNLSTFVQTELKPIYEERVKQQHYRIFDAIQKISDTLPPKTKGQIDQLIVDSKTRLDDKPVVVPFSRESFAIDLGKTLRTMTDNEALINQIISPCKHMPHNSKPNAATEQMKAINGINVEIKKQVSAGKLNNSPDLKELFETASNQIKGVPSNKPFSNKSFNHDLHKILAGLNNSAITQQMENLISQQPNSLNDFGAFVVKLANKSSTQIAMALLDPSIASIEHVWARSLGGADNPNNYMLACKGVNSARGNETLFKWLTINPGMAENIQKSFNKLIELQNNGTFEKLGVPRNWLQNVAKAVETESGGIISPNLSALKGSSKHC